MLDVLALTVLYLGVSYYMVMTAIEQLDNRLMAKLNNVMCRVADIESYQRFNSGTSVPCSTTSRLLNVDGTARSETRISKPEIGAYTKMKKEDEIDVLNSYADLLYQPLDKVREAVAERGGFVRASYGELIPSRFTGCIVKVTVSDDEQQIVSAFENVIYKC